MVGPASDFIVTADPRTEVSLQAGRLAGESRDVHSSADARRQLAPAMARAAHSAVGTSCVVQPEPAELGVRHEDALRASSPKCARNIRLPCGAVDGRGGQRHQWQQQR